MKKEEKTRCKGKNGKKEIINKIISDKDTKKRKKTGRKDEKRITSKIVNDRHKKRKRQDEKTKRES